MEVYDLAVFWEWDYDKNFVTLLQKYISSNGLRTLLIEPVNLPAIEKSLLSQEIIFNWYLDRASESDPRFLNIVHICENMGIEGINPAESVLKALSKSYMHRLLLNREIPLPETLILPSYAAKPELPFFTLADIGIPFVLKPSNGGGGEGVHLGLTELSQVAEFRKEFPESEYLVQQTVIPKIVGKDPVWLRVFYVCDEIFFTFWNPETKLFYHAHPVELEPSIIKILSSIMQEIAKVSKLRFFSTEIALKPDSAPMVIDYVNDPVDLRPKSFHKDGIPDEIMEKISMALLKFLVTTPVTPKTVQL